MRKLSMLASLLLVWALVSSYAVAAPTAENDGQTAVVSGDVDGSGTSMIGKNYKDKLEGRNNPGDTCP